MSRRPIHLVVAALLLASSTTVSAHAVSWQARLIGFLHSVQHSDDHTQAYLSVTKDCVIEEFGRAELLPLTRLIDVLDEQRVLCALAYEQPPRRLASDLAERLEKDQGVPKAVVDLFGKPGDKADKVALEWLRSTLKMDDESPVGVIVLFDPQLSDSDRSVKAERRIRVLLLRGEVRADGVLIDRIAFGSVRDALQ